MKTPPSPSKILLLVSLVLLFYLTLPTSSALAGFRVELTHVDSTGNFSAHELLRRAVERSDHRILSLIVATKAARLAGSTDEFQAPVHPGSGQYLMDFSIGTPSQPFRAIIDSGSDLTWTQCQPCDQCYPQPIPIYDSLTSSTYTQLSCQSRLCRAFHDLICDRDCEYVFRFGDGSTTMGVLASETFTFGNSELVSVPNIGFGCSRSSQGGSFFQASGMVGLGRGPLSLMTQLGLQKFSYCLTMFGVSKNSPLLFGSLAHMNGDIANGPVQSTPLVQNPLMPSYYYLNLQGITVGDLLPISSAAFAINGDGTGGFIIDSGSAATYLEEVSYELLAKAFRSKVNLPAVDGSIVKLDVCFSMPSDSSLVEIEAPKLVFHFEGADLEILPQNYFAKFDVDDSTSLLCLMIRRTNLGMSLLGSFQQRNTQMLFDLQNEKLSFMPAQCDQM